MGIQIIFAKLWIISLLLQKNVNSWVDRDPEEVPFLLFNEELLSTLSLTHSVLISEIDGSGENKTIYLPPIPNN